MNENRGYLVVPLADEMPSSMITWIEGGPVPEGACSGLQWLLAYCSDGLVWGRLSKSKWLLSSEEFHAVSPKIHSGNLQQLRMFGSESEVLIWRNEETFTGRVLRDNAVREGTIQPKEEVYVLLGDRVKKAGEKFTLVADAAGLHHAVPIAYSSDCFKNGRWPLRLAVKHYFNQDEESGVVRIAASRLTGLALEGD